jgi:hypothetical protein
MMPQHFARSLWAADAMDPHNQHGLGVHRQFEQAVHPVYRFKDAPWTSFQ